VELNKIVDGCKRNDRSCQEQLYKFYFSDMMMMCMRYIQERNRAAEVVNDGFMKVFMNISQYENKGSFEGWVRRIIFRCLADSMKKENRYLKFMVFEDHDLNTRHRVLDKLFEEDILKLIDNLPPASADIFILYAVEGYSHKDIADMKKISVGTSKWHLSEARKKLQDLIKENYSSLNAG